MTPAPWPIALVLALAAALAVAALITVRRWLQTPDAPPDDDLDEGVRG